MIAERVAGRRHRRRVVAAAAIAACIGLLAGAFAVPPGSPAAASAADGAAGVIAKYQAQIPQLMAQQDVPGLAVALVDGDQVLWTQGFGHLGGDGSAAVTPDTIFSVQSMSKLFTATAVMEAVGEGLVDLDVPVTTYLPDFTVHSAFEQHPERKITMRMLLSHTAGFTHEAPVGNNYSVDPGTFDAHCRSISDTWLRFPVGTGFAYSNLGIDLAGCILEQVEGKSFAALMRDELLQPLGMDHSTFDRAQIRATTDRAIGHDNGIPAMQVDVPMTAAGGLYSSATDLAQFLRFELDGGSIDSQVVLAPGLLDEQRTIPPPNAGDSEGYALGVERTCWHLARNTDLFNHGGGGWGFLSDLWWAPKLGVGIAVLTNSADDQLQGNLAISILDDLIGTPGSVFNDRLMALPEAADVGAFSGDWVPPADLAGRIAQAAMPPTSDPAERWAGYVGAYKTTSQGVMDPLQPPERFVVDAGTPSFDSVDDSGAVVRHALTEIRPGIFLADNGETLDFTGPVPTWRNLALIRVTGGPAVWQWGLLAAVDGIALLWLGGAVLQTVRRRRSAAVVADGASNGGATQVGPSTRPGRGPQAATALAVLTATLALATTALLVAVPGLVDSGFLGWLGLPLVVRLVLHLPLALALATGGLAVVTVLGLGRRWWSQPARLRYGALALTSVLVVAQLAVWHLIGLGLT